MFLAGTAVEVTPVQSVGPWKFEVGDLTRQLASDYEDLVNGRIPNIASAPATSDA
jgi:branched-chain amino acid aminotransferase